MKFNLNGVAGIAVIQINDKKGHLIHVLTDNQGHVGIVQNDLFHLLYDNGEIKSAGKRKKFVHIPDQYAITFSKGEYQDALPEDIFDRLFTSYKNRVRLRLIDYDATTKAIEKHYHGLMGGLILRELLDRRHSIFASHENKKFTPSKHKTKDEVIDNLKQSNAKWEQAVNEKAAAYKKLTVENESLHNKLAAAAIDNDELKVRNTKLNNEVAELKSTLYDRAVNVKKSWWQNVKGVFSR